MEIDFDTITFDCYGTLIDWESGIINAFQSALSSECGEIKGDRIIELYSAAESQVENESYRSYREVLGETAGRVAKSLGCKLSTDASFLAEGLAGWTPFPDTNAALERLATRFKLGILSNTDDDLLASTRKHFTVNFDLIVTAQQVKSYKPGLAHFKEASQRLGGPRFLHAAQSYFHDVVPARHLSIPCVWVNRKKQTPELGGPLPDREVHNLTQLADLLGV
jgi:2-haloalkanoic acid dehalogenase type II